LSDCSSHVLLSCLYTFAHLTMVVRLLKPCVIAMFVYLRSSRVLLSCLYTFVQAVCYCHVCIPSFKLCVIAMFVYLRSSRVSLPCVYAFVQAVCYCHVCISSPRQQHHNYILLYCYNNVYSIIRKIWHISDYSSFYVLFCVLVVLHCNGKWWNFAWYE
jgi:hypothetical protein